MRRGHALRISLGVLVQLLFIASFTHLSVSASSQGLTQIFVGDGPNGIAFDPANGNLYVADFGSGNVSVINGTTNQVSVTINLGIARSPWEVAYDPFNSDIYVSQTYNGSVDIINGTNNSLITTVTTGSREEHPNGIAFDSYNSEMYVVEAVTDSVLAINNESNTISGVANLGSTIFPWGITYDSCKSWIVRDQSQFQFRLGA